MLRSIEASTFALGYVLRFSFTYSAIISCSPAKVQGKKSPMDAGLAEHKKVGLFER